MMMMFNDDDDDDGVWDEDESFLALGKYPE